MSISFSPAVREVPKEEKLQVCQFIKQYALKTQIQSAGLTALGSLVFGLGTSSGLALTGIGLCGMLIGRDMDNFSHIISHDSVKIYTPSDKTTDEHLSKKTTIKDLLKLITHIQSLNTQILATQSPIGKLVFAIADECLSAGSELTSLFKVNAGVIDSFKNMFSTKTPPIEQIRISSIHASHILAHLSTAVTAIAIGLLTLGAFGLHNDPGSFFLRILTSIPTLTFGTLGILAGHDLNQLSKNISIMRDSDFLKNFTQEPQSPSILEYFGWASAKVEKEPNFQENLEFFQDNTLRHISPLGHYIARKVSSKIVERFKKLMV